MPQLPWLMVEEGIKRLREVAGGENTQAMTNSLDDWSGPGKRNIGRQRRAGTRELKDGSMRVEMKCEELCVNVNAVQKTSTTEDELSNQVDRVTRLADINQTLSSPTSAWHKQPVNRAGLVEGLAA